MRVRTISGLAAVVVTLLLAGLTVASAHDTETRRAASRTDMLQPGDNFVGWVAEPKPVAELFAEFPQISLIYTWDPAARLYRTASRENGGTLVALEPGEAATIRIDSDQALEWERPLVPAKGMVPLSRGVNWVTWVGRDEWPLDQVVRGIGTSLISIRVGDKTWPAPLDASLTDAPVLRRGDALEVTVSRDLRWLQPTGTLPKIHRVGTVSASCYSQYSEWLSRTVDYISTKFGVEADPSQLAIYLWDGDLAALENDTVSYHIARQLRWLAGPGSTVAADIGIPYRCRSAGSKATRDADQSNVTHEYFHIVQCQLAATCTTSKYNEPAWLAEGTAFWAEIEHGYRSPPTTPSHISLRLTEGRTYNGREYSLGRLATLMLVEDVGVDAVLEFWRLLVPQATGPGGHWRSIPHWRSSFLEAFDVSVEDFYTRFEVTQRQMRDDNNMTPPTRSHITRVTGRVDDEDGEGISGVTVLLETASRNSSRAISDASGSFALDVDGRAHQHIGVFPTTGCGMWLTEYGWSASRTEAQAVHPAKWRTETLDLTVPRKMCASRIEARIVTTNGQPVRGAMVWISGGEWYQQVLSDESGLISLSVPIVEDAGLSVEDYVVNVWPRQDCWGSIGSGGVSIVESRLVPIPERSGVLLAVDVEIQDGFCTDIVEGQLVDSHGVGMHHVLLSIGGMYTFTRLDGTFTLGVRNSRRHHVSIVLSGECWLRSGDEGLGPPNGIEVPVGGRADIILRLPEDPTTFCS